MRGCLLILPGSGVAVQAFAVVISRVELDLGGLGDFPKILNIYMVQAAPFRAIVAEHRVIGVTGEAGMIARNKGVLEMRGREVAFFIDVQTLAEIRHYMARKEEHRRL